MKDSDYAILKLQEIIDDMTQALAGLAKSLNKTKAMVECLQKTKRANEFKEDCDAMMKAHDAKVKEYEALKSHRNLLSDFMAKYKASSDIEKALMSEILLTVFIAFNVIQDGELESNKA